MSAGYVIVLFLVLWSAHLLCELGLNRLNVSFVSASALPEFFRTWIDQETHSKSVKYTVAKGNMAFVATIYSALIVLFVAMSGLLGGLDSYAQSVTSEGVGQGVVFILAIYLVFSILEIPVDVYSTFVVEEKFGFNRMGVGLWVRDLVRKWLVSLIIMAIVVSGILWFMESSGGLWWLYAFLFLAFIQITLTMLYPVLILPLFNKFSPLEGGTLRESILALAERTGFATSGIFLMDGGKRSSHANAFFAGLGRYKRIVLFDTLVSSLKQDETLAVLAHEIGHEKGAHIKKSFALSLLISFVGFWILSILAGYQPLYEAFGLSRVSNHAALVIFALIFGPVMYFISPLLSGMSRRFEYEADRFAVRVVGGWQSLASALCTLSRDSLSNLTPHPYYSFFHYSHPTLAERIKAMQAGAE